MITQSGLKITQAIAHFGQVTSIKEVAIPGKLRLSKLTIDYIPEAYQNFPQTISFLIDQELDRGVRKGLVLDLDDPNKTIEQLAIRFKLELLSFWLSS